MRLLSIRVQETVTGPVPDSDTEEAFRQYSFVGGERRWRHAGERGTIVEWFVSLRRTGKI